MPTLLFIAHTLCACFWMSPLAARLDVFLVTIVQTYLHYRRLPLNAAKARERTTLVRLLLHSNLSLCNAHAHWPNRYLLHLFGDTSILPPAIEQYPTSLHMQISAPIRPCRDAPLAKPFARSYTSCPPASFRRSCTSAIRHVTW